MSTAGGRKRQISRSPGLNRGSSRRSVRPTKRINIQIILYGKWLAFVSYRIIKYDRGDDIIYIILYVILSMHRPTPEEAPRGKYSGTRHTPSKIICTIILYFVFCFSLIPNDSALITMLYLTDNFYLFIFLIKIIFL